MDRNKKTKSSSFTTSDPTWLVFPQKRHKMRPYDLRQSIRCPKKYGETTKERQFMLTPHYDLDLVCEQREDPKRPLDKRYIRNAAVIPDLNLPHRTRVVSNEEKTSSGDLTMHGYTVPDYQQTYHSVVDPLLLSPSGERTPYSLELGHTIKEHLFEELAYPKLQVSEYPDGKVEVTERFCVLRPTPYIDVDLKGEPP